MRRGEMTTATTKTAKATLGECDSNAERNAKRTIALMAVVVAVAAASMADENACIYIIHTYAKVQIVCACRGRRYATCIHIVV